MQSSEDGTHSLRSFCPLMRKGPLRPACKDPVLSGQSAPTGRGLGGGRLIRQEN